MICFYSPHNTDDGNNNNETMDSLLISLVAEGKNRPDTSRRLSNSKLDHDIVVTSQKR